MVLEIFQDYPGFPGLFLACVYSGSFSTVSTAITAAASVTIEDYIKPAVKWDEKTLTWISRGLIVCYGVICILFSYISSKVGALFEATISLQSIVGGPLVGIYTLGILFPYANSVGALVGSNVGLAAIVWVFIGSRLYPTGKDFLNELSYSTDTCPSELMIGINSSVTTTNATIVTSTIINEPRVTKLYSLSFMLYSAFGFCWTVVIGILVSVATGGWKQRKTVDPRLLYHFFDHWIFGLLPRKFHCAMRCGLRDREALDGVKSTENDVSLHLFNKGTNR
ncbi:unnamed protein product [Clavelina lepadiformis]|uniref:Sodium-coupled monocarboxylate transporter 1 n=1 Tax=Clavelina lepadiformis TaxID=159417 RepID=A0ABP0FGY3_CLALP